MGADMLSATLLVRNIEDDAKFGLDFEAGHKAIDALDWTTFDDYPVDELMLNYGVDDLDPTEYTSEALAKALHQALKDLEETLFERGTDLHVYGELAMFIAGGMSWGDTPEGCQEMWTIQNFPQVHDAIGFVSPDRVTVKEA